MEVASFPLNDCHGYSVKFSPFVEGRLACAASQNYGLSGLYVILFWKILFNYFSMLMIYIQDPDPCLSLN